MLLSRSSFAALSLCLLGAPWAAAAQASDPNAGNANGALAPAATPKAASPNVAAPKAPVATPAGTSLTWLGHSAWLVKSPAGTTVLIDPWLDNPRKPSDFTLPESLDAILVTHGHADHLGETTALAEKMHVPVIGSFELIEQLGLKDGIGSNPGGTVVIKDLTIHLTQAIHSSSLPMHAQLPEPPPPCDHCPPDHACPMHNHGDHHEGHAHAKGPHSDDAEAKQHGGHHHGHHGHEAKEVVVPGAAKKTAAADKAPADKMGPAEKAVTQAVAQAARAEAPKAADANATDNEVPCHCDHEGQGEHAPVPHGPKPPLVYGGSPLGFVIEVAQGPTLYHAGDTDLFLDMGLIKRRYSPEVALLPIGGHYTMGPKDAAMAASMLGVKDVVPMHYGTSPQLTGTPKALADAIGEGARVIAPRPGATITYAIRH